MGNLSIELAWCASWEQDSSFRCTLRIVREYFDAERFDKFLLSMFGDDFGLWFYDNTTHGIEVWFRNKEDMLTFKMLTQTTHLLGEK